MVAAVVAAAAVAAAAAAVAAVAAAAAADVDFAAFFRLKGSSLALFAAVTAVVAVEAASLIASANVFGFVVGIVTEGMCTVVG